MKPDLEVKLNCVFAALESRVAGVWWKGEHSEGLTVAGYTHSSTDEVLPGKRWRSAN